MRIGNGLGFCVTDFATLSEERMSNEIFLLFNTNQRTACSKMCRAHMSEISWDFANCTVFSLQIYWIKVD